MKVTSKILRMTKNQAWPLLFGPKIWNSKKKTIAFSAIGWSVFVMVKCGCDILGCSSAKYTKYSYCEMLHYPSILDEHL